ncbi:copper resistance system multicopper oxidase [Parvularcula sp. ZS-1/3]|uniref:Copper resistance system multicopper oxidase n=1 Tax=Parvularcula mediterranea TaxID=2732508 RepID=A0A7Y3RPL3_9PROT|nr:copper resistance system multicopper oxidase [Parvularcula mediterranea]NNU17052.1 copper resistance system multicopper oxidase [Parvularcula mediterranea]
MLNRRHFLTGTAAALTAQSLLPAWAQSGPRGNTGLQRVTNNRFDFTIDHTPISIDGRRAPAVTVNGTLPAPLVRLQEGEDVLLRVENKLDEWSSIHWHGLLVPFEMDGVPGVSFPGIAPRSTFEYRFPLKQAGTYWYHSHSAFQEQLGLYGPLVIDPAGPEAAPYDREFVIVLSDWTFQDPHRIFAELKKMGDSLNYQKRTAGDLIADAREDGLGSALENRAMWGRMRMMPTDIADVNGAQYTYLVNGHGPSDDWTGIFEPGESVRLRIINASAMSIFNVRIPGLPMTVVNVHGLDVRPVTFDEFQIGTAETYDVIVEPQDRAYRLVAASIDSSGQALATLTPRMGETAEAPPLRPRPLLTMKDMGMAGMAGMSGMDASMATPDEPGMQGQGHNLSYPDDQPKDRMKDGMHMGHESPGMTEHDHPMGPAVAATAMNPVSRLDEPGIGLERVPHRTLSYSQLRSRHPNTDRRPAEREIELHLTSNMERYMWSFDGVRFSEVEESIKLYHGERVRMTLVNDTMMPHPIHLHGMFFDLVIPGYEEDEDGERYLPGLHTILVKPGEKLSVEMTPPELGDWAFHCHLLYHMHAGMMQVVSVLPPDERPPLQMVGMGPPAATKPDKDHDAMSHGDHGMTGMGGDQ